MVTGLDAQIETLETLKRGETPPPPKMLPVPVKEPEVKVVEVSLGQNLLSESPTIHCMATNTSHILSFRMIVLPFKMIR